MYRLATETGQVCSVNRLHHELQLPYKYLGRLMHRLAEARLVETIKGKQGGYRLTRLARQIYLYEIIGAVEGLENYQRCILGFPECSSENPCVLHEHWIKMRENMQELIFNVSLEDLRAKRKGHRGTEAQRHKGTKAQRHKGTMVGGLGTGRRPAVRQAQRHKQKFKD
jgi:Rrf2 family iron-sulfur cluster assembly transcriptional regulator